MHPELRRSADAVEYENELKGVVPQGPDLYVMARSVLFNPGKKAPVTEAQHSRNSAERRDASSAHSDDTKHEKIG
jgi:hypothetical protein